MAGRAWAMIERRDAIAHLASGDATIAVYAGRASEPGLLYLETAQGSDDYSARGIWLDQEGADKLAALLMGLAALDRLRDG